MELAREVMLIKYDNKYLAYNYFSNRAVLINEYTYKQIDKIKKNDYECTGFLRKLTEVEVKALIKNGIIYENMDEYKRMDYALKLKNRKPKVEISVAYFHITQRCNLSCSYCYNKCNLNKPDKLSTKQIFEIIDKLYQKGVKMIVLTGGEATVRRDIFEIVKYCKNLGLRVNLLTNGTNLLRKIELFEYIDFSIISLDTINKKNNQRYGLDIDNLISALKIVSKKYKNKIAVRSVVSKFNISDIEETRRLIEEELELSFITAIYIPNNLSEVKYMINYKDIEPDCDSQNFGGNICGATYKIIAIDSNGDLYPCQCLIKSKYHVGNILNEDWFEKLEEHDITNDFKRRTVLNIEKCKECEFKYLCGGGCRAISDNLYNNLDSYIECICPFQKDIAINKLISLVKRYG
ncbi:radical SAM protein [Gemella morbillorum]